MMLSRSTGLLVGLVVCGVLGCERREAPTERTRPTEPEMERPMVPGEPARPRATEPSTSPAGTVKGKRSAAIDAIANARCERERRCGRIGAGKRHTTVSECVADTREDWREDLDAYECPGGIVDKELKECLAEIDNEDCANPFDTIGRVMACRASDICKNM